MQEKSPKTQTPSKPHKPKPTGIISSFIGALFKFVLISLLGTFLLSLSFIVLMLIKGRDATLAIAQSLLNFNTDYLAQKQSFFAMKLSQVFFAAQACLEYLLKPLENIGASAIHTCLQWIFLITGITFSRMLIFCLALPLMGLIVMLGFIDGLAKRDIRKFQGARESTFLFHRPKPLFNFYFFIPILIYLSIPYQIFPGLFFITMAITLGIITNLSLTYFKKYL